MSHAETPYDARMGEPATQAQLLTVVERQPYPLLFMTLSGAHLDGFPSIPDTAVHVCFVDGFDVEVYATQAVA